MSDKDRKSIKAALDALSSEPYDALLQTEQAMKRALFLLKVEQQDQR